MSDTDRGAVARAYGRLLEHVALPAGDLVLRTELMAELRRWRRIQHLDRASLDALQRDALERLLTHATARVPHYRGLRVSRSDDPFEWLRRFPILTKADLRERGDRLLTPGVEGLIEVSSSGSSGVQSTLWCTAREMSRSQAIQTLWWEWAGYRLGDALLQTGMTPERGLAKRVKDRLLRTTYVVAFGLTDDDVARVLAEAPRRRWRHFGGYASSLDAFARVARDRRLDANFRSAISWGDKLYDGYRQRVRDHLGAPTLDTYGAAEGFMIAAQRSPGPGPYYVMSPHVVVELLDDDDQPVAPGTMGHVVVTRLDALTMPSVRFRLGDLAVAADETAPPTGVPAFPRLDRIVGRETDVWRSPGGRTLTVHTFTGVLEHFAAIEQFSVVPGQRGLTMEYIAEPGLDPDVLTRASRALCDAVGEELKLDWVVVDTIPDSPSGKPQIIRASKG